jgi:hypothetical protein
VVEDGGAVLKIGWKGEWLVSLSVGDDKVIPLLHFRPRSGESIKRRLWAVDPVFAMPDVERLCFDFCRANRVEESVLVVDGDEVESDGCHYVMC